MHAKKKRKESDGAEGIYFFFFNLFLNYIFKKNFFSTCEGIREEKILLSSAWNSVLKLSIENNVQRC